MAIVEPAEPTVDAGELTDETMKVAMFNMNYFKDSKICGELDKEGLVFADKYQAAKHLQGLGPLDPEAI